MERDFNKIPQKHMQYLSKPSFGKERIEKLKKAVIANSLVLNKVVQEY